MNRPSRLQMKINSTLDTTVGGSCSGSPTSTSFVAAYCSGIRLSISVHWQACQQQQSLNDKNAAEYIRWIVKTMNKYISSLMPGCTIFNGVHMSQYCTSDIIRSVLITWQWPWFYFLFLPLVFSQSHQSSAHSYKCYFFHLNAQIIIFWIQLHVHSAFNVSILSLRISLQCFDTVGWVTGRASSL